jgi:hypothetical protein
MAPARTRVATSWSNDAVSIWDLIHRWDAWICEFEDGPLDFFEYVGMLGHRDVLAEQLALGGDQRAMDAVEELDESPKRTKCQGDCS